MGKLISSINMSADGYCNHDAVIADDELHHFAISLLEEASLVLFGRKTYELFRAFWPLAAEDEALPAPMRHFARLIGSREKLVVSQTLQQTNWQHTTIIPGFDAGDIARLRQQTDGNILVFGSPSLVSALTEACLIDEYYIAIQPIIAGGGKRLFAHTTLGGSLPLQLRQHKTFASGVALLHYKREQG